jgi:transcriptional regulator with XRE-family HTH domain
MAERTVHHGRNIKRIREIQGIKQEALALEMGEDWNQKKISLLESKETIDDELISQVAKALKVPSEAIKNFNEEAVVTNISCNFHDFHDNAAVFQFNPIEKIVELYERLLQSEQEKVELLEKVLELKK